MKRRVALLLVSVLLLPGVMFGGCGDEEPTPPATPTASPQAALHPTLTPTAGFALTPKSTPALTSPPATQVPQIWWPVPEYACEANTRIESSFLYTATLERKDAPLEPGPYLQGEQILAKDPKLTVMNRKWITPAYVDQPSAQVEIVIKDENGNVLQRYREGPLDAVFYVGEVGFVRENEVAAVACYYPDMHTIEVQIDGKTVPGSEYPFSQARIVAPSES